MEKTLDYGETVVTGAQIRQGLLFIEQRCRSATTKA
jgi:hypothetical protein